MRRPFRRAAAAAVIVPGAAAFAAARGAKRGQVTDLAAVLVVRDCDGPDGKFSPRTPVVVEFPSNQFMAMTRDGVELAKR